MIGRELFTDKSRLGFHPDYRRTRVWKGSRNLHLRHIQEVFIYRGGTTIIWDDITGDKTYAVFLRR